MFNFDFDSFLNPFPLVEWVALNRNQKQKQKHKPNRKTKTKIKKRQTQFFVSFVLLFSFFCLESHFN